jgi:hypothetical protein
MAIGRRAAQGACFPALGASYVWRMTKASPILAALALALPLAAPSAAWEASVGAVCTLTHETESASLRLTYDPALPEYTITVTLKGAVWPDAPVFAMRFDGARPNTIATDRQVLSEGGTALTVTDRGFGNVLDGLQFNETATAFSGDTAVTVPLAGASGPVQAFRDCAPMPAV